jgi:hypothetical protein
MANSALQEAMTLQNLTAVLAEKVMGWSVGPNRFLKGNRTWIRRSRFQPTENMQDAHKLLLAADAIEYTMSGGKGKMFWAEVQIGAAQGKAVARSMPLAICLATARALGIEIEVCD